MKRLISLLLATSLILTSYCIALDDEEYYDYEFNNEYKVMFNDTLLDLKGVLPELTDDDDIMIPVRAFFEEIGASVSYSETAGEKTVIITLENKPTLIIKAGSDTFEAINNDETIEAAMDVAPYISETGILYADLGNIGDALDYYVKFNIWSETIYVIDKEALINEIDKNFAVLNRLIQSGMKYYENTYSSKLDAKVTGTIYGDKAHDIITLDVKMDMLNKGMNANASGSIKLSKLPENIRELINDDALIRKLSNANLDLIFNYDESSMYIKSNLLEQDEPKVDKNTWVKSDLSNALDDYELYADLESFTMGKYINSMIENSYYYGFDGPYMYATELAAKYRIFFGDEYLTARTVGNVTTYSSKLNNRSIKQRALEVTADDKNSAVDILDWLDRLPKIDVSFSLKEINEVWTNFDLDGSVKISSFVPIDISFHMSSNENGQEGFFEFAGKYIGKYRGELKLTRTKTVKELISSPPEGDTVVDESDL